MDKLMITKGSKLYVDGKEIGHTIKDVPLQGAFETERKLKGELVGYTSISNIRANTFPENAFMEIINSNGNSLATNQFQKFFKNFEFRSFDSLMPHFKAYEIDENWIDDPSPLLRLWILFKDDKFYGVFHSRPLPLNSRPLKSAMLRYGCGFVDKKMWFSLQESGNLSSKSCKLVCYQRKGTTHHNLVFTAALKSS